MSLMPVPYYRASAVSTIGSIDFELDDSEWLESTTDLAAIGTGDFTMEAWIKPESLLERFNTVMGVETWTIEGVVFYVRDTSDLQLWGLGGTYRFPAGVVTGSWQHVAVTRTGTTVEAFLDGTSVGTDTAAYWGNNLQAGKLMLSNERSSSPANYFDGKIALARWSDIVRYSSNFTPETDYGVDGNTLALIGSDGSTISESTGGFSLTLNGTPTADAEAPS